VLKVAMRREKPVKIGMVGRCCSPDFLATQRGARDFSSDRASAIRATAGLASVGRIGPGGAGFIYEKRLATNSFG